MYVQGDMQYYPSEAMSLLLAVIPSTGVRAGVVEDLVHAALRLVAAKELGLAGGRMVDACPNGSSGGVDVHALSIAMKAHHLGLLVAARVRPAVVGSHVLDVVWIHLALRPIGLGS